MRPKALYLVAAALLGLGCSGDGPLSGPPPAVQLQVAVASNMQPVIQELVPVLEAETGAAVRISTGSSGTFYAQIVNGAPFDVFVSADATYPQRLHAAGLAHAPAVYALGRLALWTRSGIPVDRLGMQAAVHPQAGKIAIANPETAPYGAAAITAMKRAGVYDEVSGRLVLGENVSQAAQFAGTGAAGLGLLPRSLVIAPPLSTSGSYWLVPQELHEPIEQAAVVLKQTGQSEAGQAFVRVLLEGPGRAVLERFGYETLR